jgi:small GTP-binding protein
MGDLRRTVLPLMLLGDGQVGKTSLIFSLTGNEFNDSQLTTVGKESYVYQCTLHGYDLKMKIWDTAGQERFKSMSLQVIKTSDAVVLVYAVNDKNSFNELDSWLEKLNETADISKKPIIIIGNKADINESERVITYEEGKEYASKKGYNFYETSAKTGQNVQEAFNDIFEQLYKIYEDEITGKVKLNPTLTLGDKKNKNSKGTKCCNSK